MMIKIVTFFLIGMAILAMFGRLRFPGLGGRRGDRAGVLPKPKRCRRCGKINVTGGSCDRCDTKSDGTS